VAVISRPADRYGTRSLIARGQPGALRRMLLGLLLSTAIAATVVLLISASLLAYGLQHRNTIFSGASSAGVDLSGMTVEEATAAMQARLDIFLNQQIELTNGETIFSATPAELGVTFDVDATVERAFAFGRQSSLWHESRNWLDALAGGYSVTPILSVSPEPFAAYMDEHASGLAVPPRDPGLVRNHDGTIILDVGEPGVAIDVSTTFDRFRHQAMVMSSDPIEIVTVSVEPAAVDSSMRSAFEEAQKIAGDPLLISSNGTVWEIPSSALFSLLQIDYDNDSSRVYIDRKALRSYFASLKVAVFTPGIDASIANNGDEIVITRAVYGEQLDVDASLDLAVAALENGDSRVELVTLPVTPNITDEDVAVASDLAARMIDAPVTVMWSDGSATIDPHYVASAVRFEINAARNPKILVKLDESTLSESLARIAPLVRVDPKNAELRFIGGQVTMKRQEDMGLEMDIAATTRQLADAIRAGQSSAVVVTKDVLPEVNGQMASTIQFPDVLASGRTEYGSSSADRFHNVELAANRLNGAMVPPGGIFSFNDAVGEVTFDSGYRTGYGIIATNGIISTVPSVGGGICQVATTVFHAAFRAGMPIERRSWHLYWIPRYGQPPSGMKGLDATVDADYNLDFKFRNGTDHWIAIVTKLDGSYLTFELVGTNPGWEVQIDDPIITNLRPASQEMVFEESAELAAGTSVFVETAHEGFDATIHRVVRHNGTVIDEVSLFSTYAPSRNVTLVGTRP
jgi:vancomycin resistance protein YoaR